ncbi:hypothetical protein CSUI_010743 [Cystoisospora suis]|uniref:Uncharacterized protein n=1 Tax=Cystoisospora suis TaxID=483139 RepID=A0A2C6KGJ3_9APIC|nr:hypothetical protein CSUI_010743 [Cystoisospora suis]
MFSSGGSSVFSGPLKGSSGEMTGPGGLSVGRGSAASGAAAVGAPGDLGGIQQHAYLPVLLQSPPVFLLHPLQEVLLHGLPRRFGSLIAGIQAPQPHTVPPLARAAAATAKALQFTAAQQPGIDLGCRRKAELHPQAELRQEFERSAMFELVRALKQRMFAVDFLRVGALLQQQQLLHRQRQLEALATTAKSGVGTVVAPSGADFTGVHAAAEAATAIGSAAASGDVLLLLRLVAPARPAGASGPGSSPSAKETGGSKGSGGGRHGGSGAGGHSGDSYRKGGVAGGKSKGKRRD